MDHHQVTSTNRPVWSWEETKAFENGLAKNLGVINRWDKIAAAVPARTDEEIKNHFKDLCADVNTIESGLVPFPPYADSLKNATRGRKKKQSGKKTVESSSKKGSFTSNEGLSSNKEESSRSNGGKKKWVPWSLEEHRLFVEGLEKYGKGDWRSISRHCVLSRTSTQVASHAQKYFNRNNISLAKRRSSIHDINIMDDGMLVSEQMETNEVKYNGPTFASIGKPKKSVNATAAYPILESSGFYSRAYQNAGTSTHKGPRTKRKGGASRVGLTSCNIPSQKGQFTQCPSTHQTVGATEVSFIADQNLGISTSVAPMLVNIVGAPAPTMSDFQAPVTGEMIGAASGGFDGFQMIPNGSVIAQTKGTNAGGYVNFGEPLSLFNSDYSHQTGRQPVLASVGSTIDATTNSFGSPVPLINNLRVSSYDFYSPEHFMDLKDLEFCFPSSDKQ